MSRRVRARNDGAHNVMRYQRMIPGVALSLLLARAPGVSAAEVVRVAPWELHNSFWMSLHQTLIADAMRSTPRDLTGLSAEDQKAWKEVVEAYRTAGGHG